MKHNDNIEKMIRENADMIKVPNELEPQNISVMLKEKKAAKAVKTPKRNAALRFAAGATAFAVVATGGVFAAKNAGMFDSEPLKNDDNNNSSSRNDNSISYGENIIDTPKASYDDVYDTLKIAKNNVYSADDEGKGFFELFGDLLFGGNKTDGVINSGAADMENSATDDMVTDEEMEMPEEDFDSTDDNLDTNDKDFSETITQVEGIDEADIVKTNGDDIFYIANSVVYRIPVENGIFGEKQVLFGESLENNEDIIDMYLAENSLVLITETFEGSDCIIYSDDVVSDDMIVYDDYYYYNNSDTNVYILDTESGSENTYTQSGAYISSRMIDNTLLLVTNDDSRNLGNIDPHNKPSYIPSYYCNGEEEFVAAEDIVVAEDITSLDYCIAAAIDVTAPEAPSAIKAFAGSSGEVYCSADNLYVTGYTYDYEDYMAYTKITRLDLSNNLEIASQGMVVGTVLNQYSMDEYEGYFRIATQFYDSETYEEENAVFVLDLTLNEVGKCEDLGIGETIRSVRFEGTMAYVVTFMQTDPLYAIDLSDPANPAMLDEFKVSGYSTYLHPYKDNLMFSFGVEADEETGWTTGIKIMMYDTTDPENLVLLDSYVWENVEEIVDDFIDGKYVYYDNYIYYDSSAMYDEKALFIDEERNLIGVPIFEYGYYSDESEWKETFGKSYFIFTFENGKFEQMFEYEDITTIHPESDGHIAIDYTEYERAVRIGEYLYVLSANHLFSVNFADMSIVDTFENFSE
ncbi:MAG: beta-propeller domain-containing protein [Oscillospiraceae bacterium]|nr:beta-propeller domain-containing protein [Oscillospiraceae bacterium]